MLVGVIEVECVLYDTVSIFMIYMCVNIVYYALYDTLCYICISYFTIY